MEIYTLISGNDKLYLLFITWSVYFAFGFSCNSVFLMMILINVIQHRPIYIIMMHTIYIFSCITLISVNLGNQ